MLKRSPWLNNIYYYTQIQRANFVNSRCLAVFELTTTLVNVFGDAFSNLLVKKGKGLLRTEFCEAQRQNITENGLGKFCRRTGEERHQRLEIYIFAITQDWPQAKEK